MRLKHVKVLDVLEVDAETGVGAALLGAPPSMAGLQMAFEARMARFVIMPRPTTTGYSRGIRAELTFA
eukprot:SAG22_NODE_2765_length_2228_cov_2.684359_2_plen_68_part_00